MERDLKRLEDEIQKVKQQYQKVMYLGIEDGAKLDVFGTLNVNY